MTYFLIEPDQDRVRFCAEATEAEAAQLNATREAYRIPGRWEPAAQHMAPPEEAAALLDGETDRL